MKKSALGKPCPRPRKNGKKERTHGSRPSTQPRVVGEHEVTSKTGGYTAEELREALDFHETWLAKPVPHTAGQAPCEVRPIPVDMLEKLPTPIGGWEGEPILC